MFDTLIYIVKVMFDYILFTLLFILLGATIFGYTTTEMHTYVTCDDPSIMKPPLPATISLETVLIVTAVAPFITMFVVEFVNNKYGILTDLKDAFINALRLNSTMCIGVLYSFFLVEVLKRCVTEPRPYFMTLCDPPLPENCSSITWFRVSPEDCRNPFHYRKGEVDNSMKSFPSGHANLSMFTAVYLIMYLQKRLRISWSQMLVPLLQLISLSWAVICATSRLRDNKHHWWDLVCGAFIGMLCGYATVVYLCKNFSDLNSLNSKENEKLEPTFQETQYKNTMAKETFLHCNQYS